ncbi:MAG TPA: serine/threonine-protein kinase [Pirellulaceae bacterium]|nr:serine/threonine-protein kinase [Pirellulaceae bacterium]HMO94401.1 serine/threonine-protein kinase [Pirellulaceae bacterium]HMP71500.1 serine/threonine-protein kinase [Pirellulaceae bacterium]
MDVERWRKIKAVFLKALQLPSTEVHDYLRKALSNDDEGQSEVLRLLKSHDANDLFLESPIAQRQVKQSSIIGSTVGEYHILRLIGAGGMGAVYEAQQTNPRRRVAVKLLRPGLYSPATLQRLSRESEILGRLQHPGIAQVYSAGSLETEFGPQPWFAMEYVEGLSLREFTQQNSLGIDEKIDLLQQLCRAVKHAHDRGVIHRDLKPANILVISRRANDVRHAIDHSPLIKILDFGVARVVDDEFVVGNATQTGELVGTPGYISPEQLLGKTQIIDARADVYSLGVIGFELLTGQRPYEHGTKSIVEFARFVEQHEPKRLGQIDIKLRGDLDAIIGKSLERDVERRYSSVADLSDDLQRFVEHQPILARPASRAYRLRKFLRRHRVLVGGVMATFLALLSGFALVAREAQRANAAARESAYESAKATAINEFITNDFLMKLLVAGTDGDKTTDQVLQQVDQAAATITQQFIDQPLAEAAVRNEVGTIYYNLRAYDKAEQEFSRARQLWQAQLGPDHPDTLKTVNNLGQALTGLGRHAEARQLFQIALSGRRSVLGSAHTATLSTQIGLAMSLFSDGQSDEAEAMLQEGLQLVQSQGPEYQKLRMSLMHNLGTILIQKNEIEQATELHQAVFRESVATYGWDHVLTWQAATRYAQTLHRGAKNIEAEVILDQVLSNVQHIGETHVEAITTRRVLARVLIKLNRIPEAIAQLELALQAAKQAPTPNAELVSRIERELRSIQK